MNSPLAYLAPAWKQRLAALPVAEDAHRAAAVDQSAATGRNDHRIGREGSDLHRNHVLSDDAPTALILIQNRSQKVPELVLLH